MINIYKQSKSANTYANLFIQEISDNVENVCLLFIGHLETIYNILVAKPGVNFTVIDGGDTTEALPYIYNGANLKESITFKDSWCKDNDTFIEGLHSIFDNMSFDLIIANPPYGKSSSLSKKIVNKMLESKVAEEYVVLAPFNTYVNTFTHIENFTFLGATDQYFTDASLHGLSLTKLLNKKTEKFKTWEDVLCSTVSKDLVQLKDAVVQYNKTHKTFYKTLHNWIGRNAESIRKVCNERNSFLITLWQPQNKVHVDESAMDIQHNLKDKPITWGKDDGGLIEFETRKEFENFRDWFYKKPGHSKEAQSTFIYKALAFLDQAYNGGTTVLKYNSVLPNLDWSHPWTDAEILAEIELPEDFLEKE